MGVEMRGENTRLAQKHLVGTQVASEKILVACQNKNKQRKKLLAYWLFHGRLDYKCES